MKMLGLSRLAAAVALLAVGCHQQNPTGRAFLEVRMNTAHASDVNRVAIRIQASELAADVLLALGGSGYSWTGTADDLPPGSDYTFIASAFDANNVLLFKGQATNVQITAGNVTPVAIIALDQSPGMSFNDTAPQVTALTLSSETITPAQTVQLGAQIIDPQTADPLTYSWSVTSQETAWPTPGSFSDSGGSYNAGPTGSLTTVWTPPTNFLGQVSFTFRIADSQGAFVQETFPGVTVAATASGSANVTVTLDEAPVINSMSADKYRVEIGSAPDDTITISATASDSTPGANLTYSWSASCLGDISTPTAPDPFHSIAVFKVTGTASADPGLCSIWVSVADGLGGTSVGTLTIPIAAAPPVILAPVIDTVSLDQPEAYGGEAVTTAVTAHDPNSPQLEPLTYHWTWTNSPASTDTGQPSILWATTGCHTTPTTATVEVSNGYASTSYTFTVQTCAPTSCLAIHQADLDDSIGDGVQWVNPLGAANASPTDPLGGNFQAYCDMTTDGGGWTLVYAYTFDDYANFSAGDNAVSPVPDWTASDGSTFDLTVPVSTTPPQSETDYNAMHYSLWHSLGTEWMVRSNINNTVACKPGPGDLLNEVNGPVTCRLIQVITSICTTIVPDTVEFPVDSPGPYLILSTGSLYDYWDGNQDYDWPTHDPCGTNTPNQLLGVSDPRGDIYVR